LHTAVCKSFWYKNISQPLDYSYEILVKSALCTVDVPRSFLFTQDYYNVEVIEQRSRETSSEMDRAVFCPSRVTPQNATGVVGCSDELRSAGVSHHPGIALECRWVACAQAVALCRGPAALHDDDAILIHEREVSRT
jgi:hypothetical protein